MHCTRWAPLLVLAGLAAACDQSPTTPASDSPAFAIVSPTIPTASGELAIVCKVGPQGSTSHFTATGNFNQVPASFDVDAGKCETITSIGGAPATVTVTEQNDADLNRVEVFQYAGEQNPPVTMTTVSGPSASGLVGGTDDATPTEGPRGVVFVFYNDEPPTPADGRMTGGGGVNHPSGFYLTFGMTVHCDILLSNNIEINWPGNQWHLDKPITSADCSDDPLVIQKPPTAPLDTFVGTAIGRLNGVDGYHLDFTFVDAGEPGTRDQVSFVITAPDASIVLDLPLTTLKNGNIQAHVDQPHK